MFGLTTKVAGLCGVLLLAGCINDSGTPTAKEETTTYLRGLCETHELSFDAQALACEEGKKIVYTPRSFGNEQLPVIFAALYCDLRFQVVSSKGGVTCVYQSLVSPEEQQKHQEQAEDEAVGAEVEAG